MSDDAPTTEPVPAQRDGTSQAARRLEALDRGYVSVDERSVRDLLAFARDYAHRLVYHPVDGTPPSDWSHFIPSDKDLDNAVAFLDDPASVSADRAGPLNRPHFVLLLTFLHLRRLVQQRLNKLTGRHLDHYYRRVLRLTKKAAVPDRVNVLLDLAAGVDRAELPAGTLLAAGQDESGRTRIYRTDRRLVASRAQVARLSSVNVEKRITGIREARERELGTQADRAMRMFKIALGRSADGPLLPGGPLPPYPKPPGQPVDAAFLLNELKKLVVFARSDLFLTFSELRRLVQLKEKRKSSDTDWKYVNDFLAAAQAKRQNVLADTITFTNASNYAANLQQAVGDVSYNELSQVKNVDDLFDQRGRPEVRKFIESKLFMEVNHFTAMMERKQLIENQWDAINALLASAGRRKRPNDPHYQLVVKNRAEFATNLENAIGKPDFSKVKGADIEEYAKAIEVLEAYFSMTAEHFRYLIEVVARGDWNKTTPKEWDRVYAYLADAHTLKVYEERRRALQKAREDKKDGGFDAMLRSALGEDPEKPAASPLDRLTDFLTAGDHDFLREVATRKLADVTPDDWNRVYRIVEVAARLKSRMPEPVALEEEWLNIDPFKDATTASVVGSPEAGALPHWKTFGRAASIGKDAPTPPPVLGWAIRSPLLELSQGKRTITLTLGFASSSFDEKAINRALDPKKAPFQLQVSTAKGWVEPQLSANGAPVDYKTLEGVAVAPAAPLSAIQFQLNFGADVDPIAPPKPAEGETASPWPILRLMLRPALNSDLQQFVAPYPAFRNLILERVHLRVKVGDDKASEGLTEFQAQNDDATIDPKRPFQPFGSSPAVGSRFLLGHPELVHKRLDTLSFCCEWMGVPADLKKYYANYDAVKDGKFTITVNLVDRGVEQTLAAKEPLFADPATAIRKIAVDDLRKTLKVSYPNYDRNLTTSLADDILSWDRYLQWRLEEPDFQHAAYPVVALKKSTQLAADIANKKDTSKLSSYQVNPPYTPKIKSLSIGYAASVEIVMDAYRRGAQDDRIDHIHPFGAGEILPELEGNRYGLLPRYDNEGELYIGIRDLQPPQTLTLLFQMAEGSGNPDLEATPIRWAYLSGDRWIDFGARHVLSDTTRGLINSGIVELDLGPAAPNTRLPGDLTWIRAAVARNAGAVCDTVAIHAQAVPATFVDPGGDPRHYDQPLPPKTITGLAEPTAGIAGIRQPYSSFGGAAEEQDATFYNRVSERLRHKQRAVTPWDYERLVLERFPQIYKVKCLPPDVSDDAESGGQVVVVVIPDVHNRLPFNPFEPKAPADLIADVGTYLADKVPASARVWVRNAHFVQVQVRVGVRFAPDADEGYYRQRLIDDLNRFLSPWAYEGGADLVIGGRIYANSIVNFIDGRPYVDYVAHITLFTSEDGRNFQQVPVPDDNAEDGYSVATSRPDGVLVAARDHFIDLIGGDTVEEDSFKGINYWRIGYEFIVAT